MGTKHDAIVVGSGPNGLAAAITLQRSGLNVLLVEAKETVGGGLRTQEIIEPGCFHDICSAVHPLALTSPFFTSLPLHDYGLEFIHAPYEAAHPFEDGNAAILVRSLEQTARHLGEDEALYKKLFSPLVSNWDKLVNDILAPLHFPSHPLLMAEFGLKALRPATHIAARFSGKYAKALWAGMAAHAIQPFNKWTTSAIAFVLLAIGHRHGWPIPKGGSQSIANALVNYFIALGGKVQTGFEVKNIHDLPSHDVVFFDVTPKQLLKIAGSEFSSFYARQLQKYRYGPGVFKIDYILSEEVPFLSSYCREAATVHIGNTYEEIALAEWETANGKHPEKPFVLFTRPSKFDPTRANNHKHIAWAYCHVPHGSTVDMTTAIENQIERFAPGFKQTIFQKRTMNSLQIEVYNPNYIGGDIGGGIIDITQLYSRPALRWSPYTTSSKNIYICSSSTPPGGGVHGMCGYHAARQALKNFWKIEN